MDAAVICFEIELGDVEELWEERPAAVLDKYKHTVELSAKFHKAGRYLRVYGNHDDNWSFQDEVARLLRPLYGESLHVYESVRIRVRDGEQILGTIWFVHGHQGTRNSDRFSRLSRIPTPQSRRRASRDLPSTYFILERFLPTLQSSV